MKRLQISMSDDVVQQIDDFAKGTGLSRSAFLSMAAMDYIKAKKQAPVITKAFADMAILFDKATKGEISKDEMKAGLDSIDGQMKLELEQ